MAAAIEAPRSEAAGAFEREHRDAPFIWSESNFRPEVLNATTRLALTQIPGERDHYENHSFRYTADPGRQVYVRVQSGLKSFGGYVLGDPVERILQCRTTRVN